MNYEVVNIEEKMVAGIKIRTKNSDKNVKRNIGMLWDKFYKEGIYESIPDKKNGKSIGLYTNYESDADGAYDVFVCCEVKSLSNLPEKVESKIIPGGKYAEFVIKGDTHKAIAEFWMKLWNMNIDRKYSCDFEEYQEGSDMNDAEVHIYISRDEL